MAYSVTQSQITGATDSLALNKLQATIQLEEAVKYEAELASVQAERLAAAAHRAESKALQERQVAAVEQQAVIAQNVLNLMTQQAGLLLNPQQEVYMSMYSMHLKTRLGPSVITTSTMDTVLDDMVKDAVRMTQVAYPLVQAELDKLATPQV